VPVGASENNITLDNELAQPESGTGNVSKPNVPSTTLTAKPIAEMP
jgi:hypothetical protein